MKIRHGWVSNSSSSSFIIKSENFKNIENVSEIMNLYEKLSNADKIWDDSGNYIEYKYGMLYFQGNHIEDDTFFLKLKSMLKNPNEILQIYS